MFGSRTAVRIAGAVSVGILLSSPALAQMSADSAAGFNQGSGADAADVEKLVAGFMNAAACLFAFWVMKGAYQAWASNQLDAKQAAYVVLRLSLMLGALGFFIRA